jgi:hypothetical protein
VVVAALVKASAVESVPDQRDPEARRNAANGLGQLAESLNQDGTAPLPAHQLTCMH